MKGPLYKDSKIENIPPTFIPPLELFETWKGSVA